MNKDNNKGMATSVRFDEKTATEIKHLSDASKMSQSDVIRHLIGIALGDKSKFVLSNQTVLSDEDKTMMMNIAARLANINTSINKIGSLINVRRRDFNANRKSYTDKISSLNNQIKHAASIYDKIKLEESLRAIEQELVVFDANAESMIEADDFEKFQKIKDEFMRISVEIGKELDEKW